MPTKTKIKTPKPYLSHSQIALVLRSPRDYVRQYIYGEKGMASIQQEYGSLVHDILEGRTKVPKSLKKALQNVPRYKETDVEIKTTLKRESSEICLLGRLDGLDFNQGEYKTGVKPWTQKMANESLQLKLYALIDYKNTKFIPGQNLTWLETTWEDAELKLTGRHETFHRGIGY